MDTAEEVIKRYFSKEKVTRVLQAEMLSESIKMGVLPLSDFKAIKSIVVPRIRIVETENCWFLDLRYKPMGNEKLLGALFMIGFFVVFGKMLFSIPLPFLLLFGALFVAMTFYYRFVYINKGIGIKVYKKEWVSMKTVDGEMLFEVVMPKYSRDEVYKYAIGNKLLDFLGFTVSSADLKVSYTFKVVK